MSNIEHICIDCAVSNGGVLSPLYFKSTLTLGACDVCGQPKPLSIIYAWDNLNQYAVEEYRAKSATPKRQRAKKADLNEKTSSEDK
jgi:hypothetical protein